MQTGVRRKGNNVLLRSAARGDAVALSTLLTSHRHHLALLAKAKIGRQLQSKADPADVIQEALLEACRNIKYFRGKSDREFAAWLRRILAGRISNHLRHYLGTQQRNARLEQVLTLEVNNTSSILKHQLATAGCSPVEQAERREMLLTLARALKSLPDHYRQVILLRHVKELPFAEVAVQMERSVASVEKLWVRALERLRTTLGEDMAPT